MEPVSLGFQKHFTPSLALVFVALAFAVIILFGFVKPSMHFENVLVFAGTLIGSITGFYFGGAKRSHRRSRTEEVELRSSTSGREPGE